MQGCGIGRWPPRRLLDEQTLDEWTHGTGPLGGELAEQHRSQGAGGSVVHDGVDLQVEQFTNPQAGAA